MKRLKEDHKTSDLSKIEDHYFSRFEGKYCLRYFQPKDEHLFGCDKERRVRQAKGGKSLSNLRLKGSSDHSSEMMINSITALKQTGILLKLKIDWSWHKLLVSRRNPYTFNPGEITV